MDRKIVLILIAAIIIIMIMPGRKGKYSGSLIMDDGNLKSCSDKCKRIGLENECRAVTSEFFNSTDIVHVGDEVTVNYTYGCICRYMECGSRP